MVRDEVSRYRLVRLLGRGGMGEVHVAEDTMLHNRQVALKLLSAGALTDPDLERRFRQECELAAQIDHPNVLPVYNYSVGEKPYIAMRYVDGTDLASEIKAHPGGLDPDRAVHVVAQVAAALDAAHRKQLRHRDVKPSNILLEQVSVAGGDHAWLFDWGIAQPIEAQPLTGLNQIVGTPHYIAPERLDGTRSDHRADVYALAVVLYECLSGRRPFAGDDMSVLVAHMHTPPPPLPGRIGDGLRAVVAKGLAKNPDERYQSAGELAVAALAAVDEERVRPREPAPPAATLVVPARAPVVRVPEVVAGALVGGIAGAALVLTDVAGLWIAVALVVAGALIAFGVRGPAAPEGPARPDDRTRDAGGFPPPRT